MEPGHAAVAIRKRVNPGEAVVGGCQRHELVGCEDFLAAIGRLETAHESRQRLVMRGLVFADIDLEAAQCARIYFVTLPAVIGAPVEIGGQSAIEFTVQPADKLGRMDGGPSPAPELPNRSAGPPFGEQPGWAFLRL